MVSFLRIQSLYKIYKILIQKHLVSIKFSITKVCTIIQIKTNILLKHTQHKKKMTKTKSL